jgi:hypothetical protein
MVGVMSAKHPRIAAAAELGNVVVCCAHAKPKPGMREIDVERAVLDLLRAHRWQAWPVIAEVTGRNRRAPAGTLDIVAFEPPWIDTANARWCTAIPWWIEIKRGDRDLTEEQLATVRRAYDYGVRVMIADDVALVAEWMRRNGWR